MKNKHRTRPVLSVVLRPTKLFHGPHGKGRVSGNQATGHVPWRAINLENLWATEAHRLLLLDSTLTIPLRRVHCNRCLYGLEHVFTPLDINRNRLWTPPWWCPLPDPKPPYLTRFLSSKLEVTVRPALIAYGPPFWSVEVSSPYCWLHSFHVSHLLMCSLVLCFMPSLTLLHIISITRLMPHYANDMQELLQCRYDKFIEPPTPQHHQSLL